MLTSDDIYDQIKGKFPIDIKKDLDAFISDDRENPEDLASAKEVARLFYEREYEKAYRAYRHLDTYVREGFPLSFHVAITLIHENLDKVTPETDPNKVVAALVRQIAMKRRKAALREIEETSNTLISAHTQFPDLMEITEDDEDTESPT